jgi:hypothetical protein
MSGLGGEQGGIEPGVIDNAPDSLMLRKVRSLAQEASSSSHRLSQQEIQSNLTYLISQGWAKEDAIEKSFTAPGGTIIPSTTNFYDHCCRN